MATYYDKREGREKPIPNCGKVGLIWDPISQRCVRPSALETVTMSMYAPSLLGLLGQDEGEDTGYWDPDTGEWCDAYSCDDGGGWDWGGGSGDTGGDTDPYNFVFDNGDEWHMDPTTGDTTFYDASDGSYYTEFAGGGYQFDYEDGSSYYEGPDGSWTDSASGCYGNADGSGGCDDGSTWGPNGEPTNVKAARAKTQQKAQEAQGKSAGASSGGGSGGGSKQGQQGQQPKATTRPRPLTQSSATVDMWLKRNIGLSAGATIAIVAGLLILPSLIKKL